MSDEQLNAILSKADDDLERLKDRCHDLYEENQRLKEEIKTKDEGIKAFAKDLCDTTEEMEDYQSRCYKAIEYVNKHLYMESTCGIQHATFDGKPSYDFNCFDLLNILQNGSDEE